MAAVKKPSEVLHDARPRLQAAGRRVADARTELALSLELRDRLVVQASDDGMPAEAVAIAAGVSRTRVLAVLVDSQSGVALL